MEWTKGTLLTGYRAQLDEAATTTSWPSTAVGCSAELGAIGPYYYAFKRILARARRP